MWLSTMRSLFFFSSFLGVILSLGTSASAGCFRCYAAIATSIDGNLVAMGVSFAETQDDADATALERCGVAEGRSCRVVYRFWRGGCGAVATGKNDQTGRVAWGTGRTRVEAMQNCIAHGVSCTIDDYRCTSPP